MIEFLLVFASTILFLLIQAFFSGAEMAMVSVEKAHLRHQAATGSKGASYALKMLNHPEWMLSTTLIGTNISIVANTTIVTAYAISAFGDKGGIIAIMIVAPLIWVFAEIIPKSIFQQKAHRIVPVVIYGLWFFSFVLSPLVWFFSQVSRFINRNAPDHASPFMQREELLSMIRLPDAVNGDIKKIEKDMIQRVFNFSETSAEQVMTPIDHVDMVALGANINSALATSQKVSHIRLPVYKGQMSNIVGMLHTLEILGEEGEQPIKHYIRPHFTTQADTSIAQLMRELRHQKELLAMVVKDSQVVGLISLEDIMEEVVEDIEDEHDQMPVDSLIRQIGARNYIVSARISLVELDHNLQLGLKQIKAASLAGMLLEHFNEIPQQGKSVQINEICYTINKASPKAILQVGITW